MEILKSIFYTLFEMSILASIIGAVTLLFKTILKFKISPQWLTLIWIVFLMALVNPFKVQSSLSIYNLFHYENNITKENNKIEEDLDKYINSENIIKNGDKKSTAKNSETLQNINKTVVGVIEGLLEFLTIIYFAVVLIKIIVGIILYSKVNPNSQNAFNVRRLNNILEDVKSKMNIDKDIKLVVQEIVSVPSVYGIWNTKIFLTDKILELSDDEVELIFTHELLHIRNGDVILNNLIQLLKMVYWFNPIIQFFLNNLKKEIELVNDEHVIEMVGRNKINLYCKTLLKVSLLSNGEYCSALSIVNRTNDLEARIKMIKGKDKFLRNKIVIVSVVLTIVLGITVCFATNKITIKESDIVVYDNTGKSNGEEFSSNSLINDEIESILNTTVKPLDGNTVISSEFTTRIHPITNEKIYHNGIDMVSEKGEKVMAIATGIVEYAGFDFKNGNSIEIKHVDQETNKVYYSFYAHLSKIDVKAGENVEIGEKIGEVGSTGMATGPHLHFEIRDANKNAVDPREYVEI